MVQSPGDFFYHVVVALCLSAGLAISLGQLNRRPQSRTASRYSLAVGGALLGWFVLIAGALFTVFAQQSANAILPPLERSVTVTAMLLIGWAFLTADAEDVTPVISMGTLVLLFTVVIGYIVTGLQWAQLAPLTSFTTSRLGLAWTATQGIVALLGLLLTVLYFRKILDAPLKITFYLLLLMGYGGTLWQMASGNIGGDYSGLSRLALFVAVPIVPLVIYRKIVYGYELALELTLAQSRQPVASPQPTFTAPALSEDSQSIASQPLSQAKFTPQGTPLERESVQLINALGLILEEAEPSDIPLRIVKAALKVLKADVGALLDVRSASYADILCAWDGALNRPIPAMMSLNLKNQATLQNAVERKQQRPLFVDRNREELEDLYNRLEVADIGSAYFQPLLQDDELVGVLVVGMPYTNRELREPERELLKGIGIISGNLLALSNAADEAAMRAEERGIQSVVAGVRLDDVEASDMANAHREMQKTLDGVKAQNDLLQTQVDALKEELKGERNRLTSLLGGTEQGLSISQRIVALNDEQEDLRDERDALAQKLEEAETALASATGTDKEALFRSTIDMLNREKHDLEAELVMLRRQLDELRGQSGGALPQVAQDMVETMTQERERLAGERDKLVGQLEDIEGQLDDMGLEVGPEGLAQMVRYLYEQRSTLQVRTDALRIERDALLSERRRFEKRMKMEEEREERLERLEAEVRHLATDREAITRQRDGLQREFKQLVEKLDKLKQQRTRLLATISEREGELEEVRGNLHDTRQHLQSVNTARGELASERDRLLGENRTLESERDQLMARIEGGRGQVEQITADARGEITDIIAEITEQRDQLERELAEVVQTLQMSEQKQSVLRNQLSQANERASSNGSHPEILTSIVQEMRTPMTSILDYVELLRGQSSGVLSESQYNFVQRIAASVMRLETMLNDMMNLTVLDTKNYPLDLTLTDVVATLEIAITRASQQFREKDLRVRLELNDNLPQIYVDQRGLSQVVGQLLTNAYLASASGGSVSIRADRQQIVIDDEQQDVIHVAIGDSGGGIAPDELSEVFAPRYRPGHNVVAGLGDTGIGLPVAKALIEAHGGRMWAETEPEVGTSFQFVLPMNMHAQAEPPYAT